MKCLVCGSGLSARSGLDPGDVMVLGINDVDHLVRPSHLLVMDPPGNFAGDRFEAIHHTEARMLWLGDEAWRPVLDASWPHYRFVPWVRPSQWGPERARRGALPRGHSSVIAAVALAFQLGATDIGVIGCDMINHHELGNYRLQVNKILGMVAGVLSGLGAEVSNLSPLEGLLTCLPRADLQSWVQAIPAP